MSDFGKDKGHIVKAVLIGVLCSVVLSVLLTCLFSMMLKLMSGIPYEIIDYVMVAIEGFSVLIGAMG